MSPRKSGGEEAVWLCKTIYGQNYWAVSLKEAGKVVATFKLALLPMRTACMSEFMHALLGQPGDTVITKHLRSSWFGKRIVQVAVCDSGDWYTHHIAG